MGKYRNILGFFLLLLSGCTNPTAQPIHSTDQTIQPTAEPAQAQSSIELPVSILKIELDDVVRVSGRYREYYSCCRFIDFDFARDNGEFSQRDIVFEPQVLQPIIESLHSLYPGSREIGYRLMNDYNSFWFQFELDDNTRINLSSPSHFPQLVPWTITIWNVEGTQDPELLASYYLFHDELYHAINHFLVEIGSETLPYEEEDKERFADYETFQFTPGGPIVIPTGWSVSGRYYGGGHSNNGSPTSITDPFYEIIDTNPVIHEMFEMGFTLYDLNLAVTVNSSDFKPIQYSGKISLLAPSGHDAVTSRVTIDLGASGQVTTTLDIEEALALVEERQNIPFLEEATTIIPEIVFQFETGREQRPYAPSCPNSSYFEPENVTYRVNTSLGYLRPDGPEFYFLEEPSAWTVNFRISPDLPDWESLWEKLRDNWLPDEFSVLGASEIDAIAILTGFDFTLMPDVQDSDPSLIAELKDDLPQNFRYRDEDPQKEGDYFEAFADSRLIIPENGDEPYFIECVTVVNSPDPVEVVNLPDVSAQRSDFGDADLPGWIKDQSLLLGVRAFDIAVEPDGTVHLLWKDDDNVLYIEGNYDGSAWTEPQRLFNTDILGYGIHALSNNVGDVHLLWDYELRKQDFQNRREIIHLWKPAEGNWQVLETWYYTRFEHIFVDDNNTIHMAWEGGDGADKEYFYAYWNETEGLSPKENIWRHLSTPNITNKLERVKIAVDNDGIVHAAWIDISGEELFWEESVEAYLYPRGIFYATRDSNEGWTQPKFIGTMPVFRGDIAFGLAEGDTPIVIWHTERGITARTKLDDNWQEPFVLMKLDMDCDIDPRDNDPWEFLRPRIRAATDEAGIIHLVWSQESAGVHYSSFANNEWAKPLSISEEKPFFTLIDAHTTGRAHIVFVQTRSMIGGREKDRSGPLIYVEVVDNQIVNFHNLPAKFGYSPYTERLVFEVDSSDHVYVIGIPSQTKIMIRVE